MDNPAAITRSSRADISARCVPAKHSPSHKTSRRGDLAPCGPPTPYICLFDNVCTPHHHLSSACKMHERMAVYLF